LFDIILLIYIVFNLKIKPNENVLFTKLMGVAYEARQCLTYPAGITVSDSKVNRGSSDELKNVSDPRVTPSILE